MLPEPAPPIEGQGEVWDQTWVQIFDCSGAPQEKWITSATDGTVKINQSGEPGLCMERESGAPADTPGRTSARQTLAVTSVMVRGRRSEP